MEFPSYLEEPAQSIIDAVDEVFKRDIISADEAAALSESIPEYINWLNHASWKEKIKRYARLVESEEEYNRRIAIEGEPQWYLDYLERMKQQEESE